MSKAILVMDMTEKCEECPLSLDTELYKINICRACEKYSIKSNNTEKPDWCPLRQINPNLIKALRCIASRAPIGNCYVTRYNCMVGGQKMGCKAKPDIIPCPYSQDEYNTDFGSDECKKWMNEIADMLEGK